MSIYSEIILDHYQAPRRFTTLKKFNFSSSVANSLCGDALTFQGRIIGQKLVDVGFQGHGCAISIASASILLEKICGLDISEIKKISSEEVVKDLGINLSPNRLKCALLSWEGVLKLIDNKL